MDLRSRRKALGLTAYELASLAGVSRASVSLAENGYRAERPAAAASKIEQALDLVEGAVQNASTPVTDPIAAVIGQLQDLQRERACA